MFFSVRHRFSATAEEKIRPNNTWKKLYKDLVTGIHLVFDVPASACRKFCVP